LYVIGTGHTPEQLPFPLLPKYFTRYTYSSKFRMLGKNVNISTHKT